MSRPPPPPSVPQLQLVVLGVGAGATHVYHGQCSSSFLLMAGDSPLLLIDSGYGAVHAARRHTGGRLPTHVYISHNHSDHAGELPVLLAVQAAAGSRMTVLAERQVMQRLQQHRLAELQSTGGRRVLPALAFTLLQTCDQDASGWLLMEHHGMVALSQASRWNISPTSKPWRQGGRTWWRVAWS
jgi:hypothetical protein